MCEKPESYLKFEMYNERHSTYNAKSPLRPRNKNSVWLEHEALENKAF